MKLLRLLLAAVVLMAGLITGGPAAMAQATTTATSSLSGLTIEISTTRNAHFTDTSPETQEEDGYVQEDFLIRMDQGEIHVSFAQGDVNTESWFAESHPYLAASFNTYAVLDEVVTPENGWALTRETYFLDYELISYFEFYFHDVNDVSLAIAVHAPEANILDSIKWTRQNVLVGGDPVGTLADTGHLAGVLDGSAGVAPQEIPGLSSTLSDWEDQGLVSETEWISPTYGTSITWDAGSWAFPFHRSMAIVADASSPENVITLATTDGRGLVYLYVTSSPPGFSSADWAAWWASDEFIEEAAATNYQEVELMDHALTGNTAGAILYSVDVFGYPYITIIDTYLDGTGNAITVYIAAAPADIADVYVAYWDGVKADGDFYPLTWTLEEIEALEVG